MKVTALAPAPDAEFTIGTATGGADGAVKPHPSSPVDDDKLRQMRDQAHKQILDRPAQEEAVAVAADELDKAIEPRVREDLDSIEIELRDGRRVLFGPVRMASFRLAEILGRQVNDPYSQMLARTILSVRSIDDKAVRPITNLAEMKLIATEIGDDGIDMLWMGLQEYWPPVLKEDLRVLKKNLRR